MSAPVLFLAAALPVWAIVLGTLIWLRRQEPGAALGWATRLTLLRGLLIGALAGCIPLPGRFEHGWLAWAPGVLYTTAALCDLLDGYLARRLDEVTSLGGRLDVAMDALGLLVAPLAGVALGRLPPWYMLLGAAYYLFQGALRLRARRGLPVYADRLRPTPHARMFAGCQMGLVATALFPVLGPPGTWIAATLFMVPTLALFAHEWLVVTGRLVPGLRGQRVARVTGVRLAALLPLVRAAVAGALLVMVAGERLPALVLAPAAFIAVGAMTRLFAFAAGAALTAILPAGGGPLPVATFVATMLLVLAGGGRATLWNPEDRWLFVRAGASQRRSG